MPHLIGDDDGVGFGVRGTCNPPHKGKGVEGVIENWGWVCSDRRTQITRPVFAVYILDISAQIAVMGELQKGNHGP